MEGYNGNGGRMKNVEMAVEGNILIIKVDLTKDFGPSSSVAEGNPTPTPFQNWTIVLRGHATSFALADQREKHG